jgi:hypothetical protein
VATLGIALGLVVSIAGLIRLLAVGAIALFVLIPLAAGPTLLLGGAITLWAMASYAGKHPED